MAINNDAFNGKGARLLSFLTHEESERRSRLLTELASLEETALERYRKHLKEHADRELSGLAAALPEKEEDFKTAFYEKLSGLIKGYGKFGFIVWDWDLPAYGELTQGWKEVHKYEVETGRDFHCTVVADSKRSVEWAQEVFDKYYSIENLKETTGLDTDNEAADKVVCMVARELVPVKYE